MDAISQGSQEIRIALGGLKKRIFILFAVQATLLWMGYQAMLIWWIPQYAFRWLGIAVVSSAALLGVIWHSLADNYPSGKKDLLTSLGAGNVLTIIRGFLICFLAGFLFSPWPLGWIAWIPGLMYSLAALADLFDGYLARRSGQVTRFGEILDMRLDGLGVLIASILLVQYDQVPAWYLLVGLARYLFLLGIWIRRRLGMPIYELTPNRTRRPFAGAQMGFIAVVLFPVFSPPGTSLVAALFALPFLVGFVLDWMAVSGAGLRSVNGSILENSKIRDRDKRFSMPLSRGVTKWIPVAVRFLVVLLLAAWLVENSALYIPNFWLGSAILLLLLGLVLITLGAAGRLAAILVLFGIGLFQFFSSLGIMEIGMLIGATALLYSGTGPFSLWEPEKGIISKRIGEV
jgi:CDP-diacylglycerol--glycerol-3-phosphate 3-phosphatidyltransferase